MKNSLLLQQYLQQASVADFVLVCQPAPNAFLLVSKTATVRNKAHSCAEPIQASRLRSSSDVIRQDSSGLTTSNSRRKRIRVVIGPQFCSCREEIISGCIHENSKEECTFDLQVPCLHILFVMIRLLKVTPEDNCLLQVPLSTAKAESLIQNYRNFRDSLLRRSSRPSCPPNSGLSSSQSVGQESTSGTIRVSIPKPIRAALPPTMESQSTNQGRQNNTGQLLLAVASTNLQGVGDCRELCNLTNGRKASSPSLTASALGQAGDASESRNRRFHGVSAEPAMARTIGPSLGGDHPRPHTAPQPDPPPRLGPRRIQPIRHASSSTFRPIRDDSPTLPKVIGRLTPIPSSETSAHNSLKHTLVVSEKSRNGNAYDRICQPAVSRRPSALAEENRRPAESLLQDTSGLAPDPVTSLCLLCFQSLMQLPCQGGADCFIFRCRTREPSSPSSASCPASFHLSCCQIWLEELAVDRDCPHCPICFCSWPVSQSCDSPTTVALPTCGPSHGDTNQGTGNRNTAVGCCCCCCCCCCSFQHQHHNHHHQEGTCTASTVGGQDGEARDESGRASEGLRRGSASGQPDNSSSPSSLVTSTATPATCTLQNSRGSSGAIGCGTKDSNEPPVLVQRSESQTADSGNKLPASHVAHGELRSSSILPFGEYHNCVKVFSIEVADGIAACHSASLRQTALQQAVQLTIRRILSARQQPHHQLLQQEQQQEQEKHTSLETSRATGCNENAESLRPEPDCLRVVFRLIQHLLDDPVDSVFLTALRMFRELLGYLVCFNTATQAALQRAIGPILRRLLRFIGGESMLWSLRSFGQEHEEHAHLEPAAGTTDPVQPNLVKANLRDRATLALVTLVELAKGQEGVMAVGRDVGCASQSLAICGLQDLTRFILSSAKFHATHLSGRLILLDKLIRMNQNHLQRVASPAGQHKFERLARRHLCSSLVFSRRHILPPMGFGAGQTGVCFPHHYQLQQSALSTNRDGQTGRQLHQQNPLAPDSLHDYQLRACRMAKRVFLAAATALLTYDLHNPTGELCSQSTTPMAYGPHEFSPREFVELEIIRIESSPLAGWLRNKLNHHLNQNVVSDITETNSRRSPIPSKPETAPCRPPRSSVPTTPKTTERKFSIQLIEDLKYTRTSNQTPLAVTTAKPPIPPPRPWTGTSKEGDFGTGAGTEKVPPENAPELPYLAVALEPAYDLVAFSDSPEYSSASDGDEDKTEDKDSIDEQSHNAYVPESTYAGRSLGSEAELQTEQAAVLRSALRRCSRSLQPLLPVPALSMVMEALRTTRNLPSTDEYYESIDWVRGPILGHGAFSQCYQARDTRTGLLMAVKRIKLGGGSLVPVVTDRVKVSRKGTGIVSPVDDRDSEAAGVIALSPTYEAQLAEVRSEVNIMLKLLHPNVLRLFGAVHCLNRGTVDVFVEWMPGGSITSLLQQYGAFNQSVTLAYGVQVVRGLTYLHKQGILHRDLKGANLLVDNTGSVVKISDFGASARLKGEESVAGQFQGQVIGTFSFMAPEVLRGETYGRACDIWSIGCCLIEMLTSKPPWNDARMTNRYALMFMIANSVKPPTYPKGLDADIVSILDACFSRPASDRPTAAKLLTFRGFSRLTESIFNETLVEIRQSNASIGGSFGIGREHKKRDTSTSLTRRQWSGTRDSNDFNPTARPPTSTKRAFVAKVTKQASSHLFQGSNRHESYKTTTRVA